MHSHERLEKNINMEHIFFLLSKPQKWTWEGDCGGVIMITNYFLFLFLFPSYAFVYCSFFLLDC